MPQDLGARLLRAGLLTRGQLSNAVVNDNAPSSAELVRTLVAQGLPEDALAGFFLSVGFGPLVEKADLESADTQLLARISKDTAHQLLALPLFTQADSVAVAMGDPTDVDAIETISRALKLKVMPRVARVNELIELLERHLAAHESQTVVRDMSKELARMNDTNAAPDDGVRKPTISFSPDDDTETTAVGKHPALESLAHDDAPVPLVRQKAMSSQPAAHSTVPPAEPWSDIPKAAGDSWADGITSPGRPPSMSPDMRTVVPTGSIAPSDAFETTPGGSAFGDISGYLEALAIVDTRDEAVNVACIGAADYGRVSIFFSVKKDVIQGRDAVGEQMSKELALSLSIPLNTASSLRAAAVQGVPYFGDLGRSAPEALYAAVVGSRGKNILFQPILIGGKTVGLLCVDGLRFGDAGREQVVMLGDALAAALSRIIKSGKK